MMDLQIFAGGHSVTVVAGENITAASASSTTDVAKDTEVTLTITPASGYEAQIQVISGGVTVNPETKKFTMGEADVVIAVTAKADNLYRVCEECVVNINGTRQVLHRNVKLRYSANGAIAEAVTEPVTISNAGHVEALLNAGLIEKI